MTAPASRLVEVRPGKSAVLGEEDAKMHPELLNLLRRVVKAWSEEAAPR